MNEPTPLDQAGLRLPELVARARVDEGGVLLADADGPVAAIVSIETYRELRAAQDAADIATCERSKADQDEPMSLDDVVALLEAEDAARL
ncbi:MAG: type II toxin-antitoxin system Phd/YefM family antitoxin [Sporichthyaceae bacterium]